MSKKNFPAIKYYVPEDSNSLGPTVSEKYITNTCAAYALDGYNGSPNIRVIEAKGFALSSTNIWCAAMIEKPIYLVDKGTTMNSEKNWFRLMDSKKLSLTDVSEEEFMHALNTHRVKR